MTRKMMTMAAGLTGMLVMAMPATAGDFSLNLGVGWGGKHAGSVGLAIGNALVRPVMPVQPFAVQPVAVQRVWVAPVYRTVVERVWVPTVETQYRDVPVIDAFGQVIAYKREAYTVTSGYWQEVAKQVLVQEGYWTTVQSPTCVTRPAPISNMGLRLAMGVKALRGGHRR